jgi:hypothetical protein
MAIIQISKIQQRAGNLVDLPQLDNAEFGWAANENRLFIGKTGNTVTSENIEVLTSYSNISFSQISGSDGGNLNITSATNGQTLTYIASTDTWENYPSTDITNANANFKLNLGNVEFLKINGGAIGYVLETDGVGNLSWTPKGALYTNIKAISNANPMVMTVANTIPYTNNTIVTISGVTGTGNTIVNGKSFYIQLDPNFSANSNVTGSGNVTLYTSTGNSSPADGAGLTATANTGVATSLTGGTGGGTGAAGGVTTTIQYNDSGVLAGDSAFTFNSTTKSITLTGNVNCANVNASTTVISPRLISNVAIGTAPLTVTSTTRVANLNVAYANVSDFSVTTLQTTGTFYPLFVNATSGNLAQSANANLTFNAATGALSATLLTGTITTAFQPNITTVGTLGALTVTGNVTSGNANLGNAVSANFFVGDGSFLTNVSANTSLALANGTSNVRIPVASGNINMSAAGNANIVVVTGTGANVTGTFGVSGNANVGNLGTSGRVIASILESNVATGTAPLTVTSTTRVSNLNVAYANVTDLVAVTAAVPGTYYPTFTTSTANANLALATFNTISANPQSGIFSASIFTATGNITGGNLATAGNLSVGGTTTLGNLLTTNITTGASATQGNLTGNWVLTAGSRLQATYADLAEYYEADEQYPPGTVLEFGGEKEVTLAEDGTSRVAGVVSTNPAYAMNANCQGIAVAIALQGRVPTKVRGVIHKGDMMVSGGNGFARPSSSPKMGTVIGKALENFDGIEGVIEIAVGRL